MCAWLALSHHGRLTSHSFTPHVVSGLGTEMEEEVGWGMGGVTVAANKMLDYFSTTNEFIAFRLWKQGSRPPTEAGA